MTDNDSETNTTTSTMADTMPDDATDEQTAPTNSQARRVHVTYADDVAASDANNADTTADTDTTTDSATTVDSDVAADSVDAKTIDAPVDTPVNTSADTAVDAADTDTASHNQPGDAFAAFHEASSADAEIDILRNELDQAHAELSMLKEQQAELEAAKQQAQEMKDKFLRARADLENYRRRAAKDVERARESGADSVILAVVPVYDDLGRALDAGVKDPSTLIPGIEAVRSGLERNLEALGIKKVGNIGDPFDPTYHEALSSIPAPDDESKGNIAQVFQVGFAKDERLIRPAQVVVYRED
jgi:molecular chaperone GrpE